MGLGPVNVAASNFFFKGELKEQNGKLSLYDCFTSQIIPINNKSAIYTDLFSKFQSLYSAPVFVDMRGFLTTNKKSQTTLTATYLNNIYEAECNPSQNITGRWISDSMGTSPEGISLTVNSDYTFNLKFTLPNHQSSINGEWQMISNNSIFFSYQELNQYFSHNGTFSEDNNTLVISTDSGAITLKRR